MFMFEWAALAIALWIGAAIGFYKEWHQPKAAPIGIRYCTRSSTDPACRSALERYDRQRAGVAGSSQGPEPTPP
jgi:hypothetical protein